MRYRITKKYDHNEGLSVVFRQWRADSHCNQLHGYALSVEFVIEGPLDRRNWVFDFGSFKQVRAWLHENFDHTLLVAEDDPDKDALCALAGIGVADVVVVPAIGCEAFAAYIGQHVGKLVKEASQGRAHLVSVEVAEHAGNSAIAVFDSGDWA